MRDVESSFRQPESGRRRPQHLGELGIRVGGRLDTLLGPVCVGDPHAVAPVDIDVLDVTIVDQRLKPSQTEQGVEHGTGDTLLVGNLEGRLSRPRPDSAAYRSRRDNISCRASSRRSSRRQLVSSGIRQVVRHVSSKPGDQRGEFVGCHHRHPASLVPKAANSSLGRRSGWNRSELRHQTPSHRVTPVFRSEVGLFNNRSTRRLADATRLLRANRLGFPGAPHAIAADRWSSGMSSQKRCVKCLLDLA